MDLEDNPGDSHVDQHSTRWNKSLFAWLGVSHIFVHEKTAPDSST